MNHGRHECYALVTKKTVREYAGQIELRQSKLAEVKEAIKV